MKHGTLKFYDPLKGYGFITPSDGSRDVFVHVTTFVRDGVSMARPGMALRYEADDKAKAVRVARAEREALAAPATAYERATVKWFNRKDSYGFVTRGNDTPDVLVTHDALRRSGIVSLQAGLAVLVEVVSRDKGVMAASLRLAD